MKLYSYYIILILVLALTFNWVVEGNSFMGKADMNLGLFPKATIMIIEALQALIFIRIILLYSNNNFILKTTLAVAAFCVFEFFIIKAVKADILIWVSGIRYYFSFFPLFLLSYLLAYKGYTLKKEIYWLLGLILLQIPVATYQFLNTSNVGNVTERQLLFDMISGTMGGFASNLMSMVIGIGLLYFLIKLFETKKLVYLVLSLGLLVPPILAEAKGMLLLLLIAFAYLAVIFKFNFSRLLVLGVVAILMIAGFTYIYSLMGFGKTLDMDYLITYANSESGSGRLSRIDSIINSFTLLLKKDTLLFGMGIGNANKSPLGHDGQYYDFFTIRHSIDILVAETGLLGIIFISYLLWNLIRMTRNLLKNEMIIQNEYNYIILRVFLGSIFMFLFGLLWVDVLFRIQFMYPFGMLAGYTIGLNQHIRSTEKAVETNSYQLLSN
jgi:hypothetical protein